MDFLSLDYRDPLYGIILLFIIMIVIYLSDYWVRYRKKKDSEKHISKFIKTYDNPSSLLQYKQLIQKEDLPLESIVLMAIAYESVGEYDKSIDIYSTLLKNLSRDSKEKVEVLTLLGKSYYKAGFLYKSRDIFVTSLKLQPKNLEALTYLVSIYENLREYDNAIEILNIIESMNGSMSEKKLYFKVLSILHNEHLNNQTKISETIKLGIDKKIVQRKLFEFVVTNNDKSLKIPLDVLHKFDYENIIDLIDRKELFSEELIKQNPILAQIFTIKGLGDYAKSSDNFEINTLLKLKLAGDNSADLSFSYTCCNCKNSFPLYFYRCPVCKNINTASINTILVRNNYEKNSFV